MFQSKLELIIYLYIIPIKIIFIERNWIYK